MTAVPRPCVVSLRPRLGAMLAILIVAVPTLTFEEFYRGMPMIDQATTQWRIPGAIVAGGFLLGGLLAGRASSKPVRSGFFVGVLAAAILIIVDVGRRLLITHQSLTWPVAKLWLAAVTVAAACSAVGGLLGGKYVGKSL